MWTHSLNIEQGDPPLPRHPYLYSSPCTDCIPRLSLRDQFLDSLTSPELVSLLSTLAGLGGPGDPLAMDAIQTALLDKGIGQVRQ